MILSEEARQDNGPDSSGEGEVRSATRWWSLRDRLSTEALHIMINLYRSGTTAKQIAEKCGVSLSSVKQLLHEHDVRREGRKRRSRQSGPSLG
ncbi:MAG: helix-turn-helix domain-containing protein [Pseudonocardiaceae bacterium]